VPKPNYAFAKRQRELAKKQKQEEKRLRKSEHQGVPSDEPGVEPLADDLQTTGEAPAPDAGGER